MKKREKSHNNHHRGLSSVELALAMALSAIGFLCASGAVFDSHRGFNTMYNRVYSDVVAEGYIAKGTFDSLIRKSSDTGFKIDEPDGKWFEVYYYDNETSTELDRYARLTLLTNELYVEYGSLDPNTTIRIDKVCGDVSSCVFKRNGASVHMLMTLDNGKQSLTIGSSAKLHN